VSEHDHPEHPDDELLSHHDKFYIQATSSRTDDRTRVLKHGQMFGVFDRHGDVQPVGLGEQGLYFDGTRFLAYREMFLNHLVHHRAQLGVYLRLNEKAVPAIYGPSADDKMGF